ncbi:MULTISPECIES: BlaI/MecI/CopY family transcriptional regulator [Paenibacillus]|uniref:BlaI/MecI/CopY family transcriptional regulator n=1 Tax=Paenibacillus TaxID=44249 RepID=UPI00096D5D29|nr:BlaI/MecI/CopY family transcriptional regulator [Paenibacillus odorifer]OME31909.1 hypothetical protein BSK58_28840 [Paenibacillus odorifer]
MINEIKKLPDAELEIMLVIWKTGNPVSSSYISNQLRNKRNWALATLMTVLSRLVDKGFLYCEKEGRSNSYRAAISETDYKECEGKIGKMEILDMDDFDYTLATSV